MKLDNRLKYLKNMIMTVLVYTVLFEQFFWGDTAFSLMNETVFRALFFGFVGVGTTCVLYSFQGSGIIGDRVLLMMCMIYLSNILLLCLLQTVCMILIENNAASILLFVIWIIIQLHGWQLGNNIWIWLPPNWGMYLRSADIAEKGVPYIAYIIQIAGCMIIWILSPIALSKLKKAD